MLVLDTCAVVALTDKSDRFHKDAVAALKTNKSPYVIPAPILSEITYMVESRVGQRPVVELLTDLIEGRYQLDCCEGDMVRISELNERYASLPLGFADAAVVACAERLDQPVLSFDSKHFDVVAKECKLRRAK